MRILALIPCLLSLPALANPVQITDFGIICETQTEGTEPAPDTESGVLNIIAQDMDFDLRTTRIPAELGLSFGIRSQVDIPYESDLTMQVEHPPLGARAVTVESWDIQLESKGKSLSTFRFEQAYELVLGTWVFRILSDGEPVAEQVFEVLPAGSNPLVQQICKGAMVLS